MKRFSALILGIALLTISVHAQGPVFTYRYLWTLDYEDLSDLLRRYPGMYPVDYGTLGAPMLFHPWNLHPWELRLERDLIPQNRRSDGLFDPNLQPASELDTIRFDVLTGLGAGEFHTQTRSIVVDTPYTEVQVREGWHGYGTIDLAHGQRVYRSMTLEMTGRLVWYNGLRPQTASRFQRVRARVGFDLRKRWRAGITYAGSNVDADVPTHPSGPYSEREEAIFELDEKDSLRTVLAPSVRVYVRQDREDWGGTFRLREGLAGWVVQAHAKLPRQQFTFRQSASYAEIGYPKVPELHETTDELLAQDSIDVGTVGARLFGSLRSEAVPNDREDRSRHILSSGGAEVTTGSWKGFQASAGTQYVEELPPIAWARARYHIADRPLLIASQFRDTSLVYAADVFYPGERGVDRYLKSTLGLVWNRGNTQLEVTGLALDRVGHFSNQFAVMSDTALTLKYLPTDEKPLYGVNLTAQVPLRYGLRIDSWSFAQLTPELQRAETRAYSRLYFERSFFTAPLTIRSHISYEYFGPRDAYSERGLAKLGAAQLVGFRLSATIQGVTLIWGTENVFKQHYQLVPGYPMMAKEEYIGIIWRLWL